MNSKSWSGTALILGATMATMAAAGMAKPGPAATKTTLPTWTPDSQLEQQLGINTKMYDFAIHPPEGWTLIHQPIRENGKLEHQFLWVGPKQNNVSPGMFLWTVPMSKKERARYTADMALKHLMTQLKGIVSMVSPTITRSKTQRGIIGGDQFSRVYFKFPYPRINNTVHGFLYTGYHGSRAITFAAFDVEPGWTDTGAMCEASVLTFHKA